MHSNSNFFAAAMTLAIVLVAGSELRAVDATNTTSASNATSTTNAAPNPMPAAPPQRPPDFPDVAYGPEEAQKIDVYVPQGPGPFPIYFWMHWGGWQGGSKRSGIPGLNNFLAKGCAVVSAEYRFTQVLQKEGVSPPVAGVLADNQHALQFVRANAAKWNLDPTRIVVGGSSAGACSALYLGCMGEKADPKSANPIEHESTKVLGVVAEAAQASLDPQQQQAWVPGVEWGSWAFGEPGYKQFVADREKWVPDFQRYSPDYLLTKDAPPIFFAFGKAPAKPGEKATSGELIHSALWGIGFQKLAQGKGVECYLQYPGHPPEKYINDVDFAVHLLLPH